MVKKGLATLFLSTNGDEWKNEVDDDGTDDTDDQRTKGKNLKADNDVSTKSYYWIRGENGLSDWYCWVCPDTKWEFSTEIVALHFYLITEWRERLQLALQQHSYVSKLSPNLCVLR